MSKHGAIKLSTLIITALLLAAALSASEAARPEGTPNSLSTEFRLIKSMEIESRYAITIHFGKPSVVFANKVNQGLFASVAFIQSKSSIESAGEDGAERRPIGTGPWKFVEHVRGDRIVYEAVEGHWRAT